MGWHQQALSSIPWAGAAALLSVIALPALLRVYGYTDDYPVLLMARQDAFGPGRDPFTFLGRPLASLLIIPAFEWAGEVERLGWLRLVSLTGLMAFGYLLDKTLRRADWPAPARFMVCLLALTSPAAMVWAGWTVCFPYSWAATAAALAGYLMTGSGDAGGPPGWRWGFSAVLLLASLAIYQPAAGAFFLPLLVRAFQIALRDWTRKLGVPVGFYVATVGLYALTFLILREPSPEANPMGAKVAFGEHLPIAVALFFRQLVPESLLAWGHPSSPLLFSLQAGGAGYLLFRVAGSKNAGSGRAESLARLLLFTGLGALVMAPVMLTEGVFYHRTRFALTALAALLLGEGWRRAFQQSGKSALVAHAAALVLLLLGLAGAAAGLQNGLAGPNAREFAALRLALEGRFLQPPRAILFIDRFPTAQGNTASNPAWSFEFGKTARHVSWAMEPMVGLILSEPGKTVPHGPTVLVLEARPDLKGRPIPILDLSEDSSRLPAQASEPGWQSGPFGEEQILPRSPAGWAFSPWFGFTNRIQYRPDKPSYLYHLELGWIMPSGQGNEQLGYTFHHDTIGWFWTAPSHYPNIYLSEEKRWAYVGYDAFGPTQLFLSEAPPEESPRPLPVTFP